MFFNEEFKPLLRLVETVVINDTFRTASHSFQQLVTIKGYIFGNFLSLIFILILSAKSVVVDFEIGLINASYKLGTDVDVYGCVFYYAQSLWRKVQLFEFVIQYKETAQNVFQFAIY
ncbi:hypothetical protein HZS_5559 [Henneguya salminicola]|nr:hypothetical protein HZS_5559 [Henneguya salminicola]